MKFLPKSFGGIHKRYPIFRQVGRFSKIVYYYVKTIISKGGIIEQVGQKNGPKIGYLLWMSAYRQLKGEMDTLAFLFKFHNTLTL